MPRVTVAALAAALIAVGPLGATACSRDDANDQREVETPEEVEETEDPRTDEEADGEPARTLDVSAEEYSFEGIPEPLPVGTTEFVFENTGAMAHDLVLEEHGDEVVVPETAPGERGTGSVSLLQRGEYTF